MVDELADRVTEFLDTHNVMSLATTGADGPHAANVFYARDGFALLWISDPTSRHSVELEADARVAATIAKDYADFATIRGLQVSGRARRITGPSECRRARDLLEAKYVFLTQAALGGVRDTYERAQIYRLDIDRSVLIDNSRGFGHKDVLEHPRGAAGR